VVFLLDVISAPFVRFAIGAMLNENGLFKLITHVTGWNNLPVLFL